MQISPAMLADNLIIKRLITDNLQIRRVSKIQIILTWDRIWEGMLLGNIFALNIVLNSGFRCNTDVYYETEFILNLAG